jgi:hypothetical protein
MSIEEQIIAFLEHGFLLQVDYTCMQTNEQKYCFLMKGMWYNKLSVLNKAVNKELIWDVVTDTPFQFSEKTIEQIAYIQWPEKADRDQILEQPTNLTEESFITTDPEYADKTALFILELKLRLQTHLRDNCMEFYHTYNQEELQDRCTMSLYPKQVQINESVFLDLKKTIIEDFFTFSKQTTPELIQYQALKMFNLKQSYIDTSDPLLITAFKNQWKRLILKEKKQLLESINSVDLTDFEEEEKVEYMEEAQHLDQELNENMLKELERLSTIREIIKFWPVLLQPIPSFVLTD